MPIYFFGGLGFLLMAFSVLAATYTLYAKYVDGVWAHRNPFLIIAFFFGVTGMQSLFLGLLAEIGIRTYHESQSRPIYWVRERLNVRASRRRLEPVARDGA